MERKRKMKNCFAKLRCYVGGLNGVLLIIYTFLICLSGVLTRDLISLSYILTATIIIGVMCFLICPLILRFLAKVKLTSPAPVKNCSARIKICNGLSAFVFTFIWFLCLYIIYYPGSFSPDSWSQYTQAITNEYNDWHPVLHTLLAFKLPLSLTGGWIGSVVLFQILVLSAVLGYSFCVIRKYAGTKFTAICVAFVLLNPQLQVFALYPWKDTAFVICTILLLTFGLQIYLTKGEWVRRPVNTVGFVIAVVFTTLIRHNAVLFTIPFALAILLCVTKKKGLILAVSAIVLFAGIKFPFYSVLNVEDPDQRQVETLGLPMTVIGTVVSQNPGSLDEETREFAYRVAPKEVWEEMFRDGSYNSVKWNVKTDNSVIEEYGRAKVISMMLRCFKSSPRQALRGLIKLTEGVYSVTASSCTAMIPHIADNDYGITQTGIGSLQNLCCGYFFSATEILGYAFAYLGVMHLLLIASVLSKCKLSRRADWKRILFILPVFAYNFGTSLLLTGAEDIQRFFMYTFPVTPLLLLFIFHQNNERHTDISVTEEV